jgi:hypothetical protein
MPVPQTIAVSHYRGDSLQLALRVWEDADRSIPADLSEATVTAQVRTSVEAPNVSAEFAVLVEGNLLTLTLSPKQTRDLAPQNVFDVEIDWLSDDTQVQTVVAGSIAVAGDVSRVPTV